EVDKLERLLLGTGTEEGGQGHGPTLVGWVQAEGEFVAPALPVVCLVAVQDLAHEGIGAHGAHISLGVLRCDESCCQDEEGAGKVLGSKGWEPGGGRLVEAGGEAPGGRLEELPPVEAVFGLVEADELGLAQEVGQLFLDVTGGEEVYELPPACSLTHDQHYSYGRPGWIALEG